MICRYKDSVVVCDTAWAKSPGARILTVVGCVALAAEKVSCASGWHVALASAKKCY